MEDDEGGESRDETEACEDATAGAGRRRRHPFRADGEGGVGAEVGVAEGVEGVELEGRGFVGRHDCC